MRRFFVLVFVLNLGFVVVMSGVRALGSLETTPDYGSASDCSRLCRFGITVEQTSLDRAYEIIATTFPQPNYGSAQDSAAGYEIKVYRKATDSEWQAFLRVGSQDGVVDSMEITFLNAEPGKIPKLWQVVKQLGPPTCVYAAHSANSVTFIYEDKSGATRSIVAVPIHPLTWQNPVWFLGLYGRRAISMPCYQYRMWQGLTEQKYLPHP